MTALKKFLERIDIKEVQEVERRLEDGSLQELLKKRLSELEMQQKTCPVCNKPITARNAFILEFGPSDFRQRATFDALDCLEYFITHMKKMKQKEDDYY
ncbi:MAG: hypothetical protein V1725_01580 [archaeon]